MTRGNLLVDTIPAGCWEDAFPVGNGRHGALVPGHPGAERVIVTHSKLTWPDAPDAPDGPPDLAGRCEEVRDLLLAGESQRALALFGGDWPRGTRARSTPRSPPPHRGHAGRPIALRVPAHAELPGRGRRGPLARSADRLLRVPGPGRRRAARPGGRRLERHGDGGPVAARRS